MDVRFVVYNPNGSLRGTLPWPSSWQMTSALNEVPALTLEYPQTVPGIDLLNDPGEVALQVLNRNNQYEEPQNCRFLTIRRQVDRMRPETNASFTMPGVAWALRKIRMLNYDALSADGRRYFPLVALGAPMVTLLTETQPNNMPKLEWTFSSTLDSQFEPWDEQNLIIGVAAGQDYLAFLDALSRQGMCDWRFDQWTLHAYNPNTVMAQERRNIVFQPYVDFITDLVDYSIEDLASRVLLEGENGAWVNVNAVGGSFPWGLWQHHITSPGLTRTQDLQDFARRALDNASRERIQITRTMVNHNRSYLPFLEYMPGDYVTSTSHTGAPDTRLRVHQITLNGLDNGEVETILTLNDWFLDREIRNQRITNGLLGFGGPGAGGGTTGWRWR